MITTPNFTHYNYIKYFIKKKIDVICEKPVLLKYNQLSRIQKLEKKYKSKVFVIYQLRYAQEIIKQKIKIKKNNHYNVNINYITPRGDWYLKSWKNNERKSGGLISNLGVHFFDIVLFLFGNAMSFIIKLKNERNIKGELLFKNAKVKWFLSNDIKKIKSKNNQAIRIMTINNKEINMTKNFEDLHFTAYKNILKKEGISISDVKNSVKLVEILNKAKVDGKKYSLNKINQ